MLLALNRTRTTPSLLENSTETRNFDVLPAIPASAIRARFFRLLLGATVAAMLSAPVTADAFESFQNGRLRFGTGNEASVNAKGNLQQPFYYDSVLGGGNWYKLTFSNYPLNNAVAIGGDGSSNWNLNGVISQDPVLTGQVVDTSGFTVISGSNGYGTIISRGNVTVGGQTFQLQNSYTLGQADSFVRIVTRITNTGSTPLQNVRVWVGTQDDWVGTTDSPTKRRGNLVNGAFVDIATATEQSSALQISSGATGVLFYSTSPGANTSIHSCCSFSNAYRQNPASSLIANTNDGSYALFVRMSDLASGQSDEFTWYYAAGELANLAQIAASVGAASSSAPVSLVLNAPVIPFVPVSATGMTGTLTYAISPALPAGLVFSSTTGEISGTPTGVSPATVYTVTITGSNSASISGTFTLGSLVAQSIGFPATAAQTFSPAGTFMVEAASSSGLPITYVSQSPAICAVSGNVVTMLGAGNCSLRATQPGDATVFAATPVDQIIAIGKANQSINFANMGQQSFVANGTFNVNATATSGLSASLMSLSPNVCSASDLTVTMISPGICGLRASQAGNANFNAAMNVDYQVQIGQISQSIEFPSQANQALAGTPLVISAIATSSLPISFTSLTPAICTTSGVNGNTVTMVALGNCVIRASQSGNTLYLPATAVDRTVVVTQANALVALTSSANPAAYGAPVILTAQVRGAQPSGTVNFIATYSAPNGGNSLICSETALVNGLASCLVPGDIQKRGVVTFQASYSGDTNNLPAMSFLQQLVSLSRTTLTAMASPQMPVAGRSLTLNALVIRTGLNAIVSFNENGTAVGGCGAVAVTSLAGSADTGTASCRIDAVTAGNHTFVVTLPDTTGVGFEQVLLNVNVAANGPLDYSDMWWAGVAENGWGVSVSQHGSTQFNVLYVYDQAGNATWYAMPGGNWNEAANAYTGVLYQPTSSPYSAYDVAAFKPNAPVGSATITYTSPSTAVLSYTINGINGTKNIVRQVFSNEDGQSRLVVNDMWWAGSQENGWGINIAQQGRMLFPVWYTYDNAGKPTFYAVPGGTWNGVTFTGDVYHPASSGWLGVPYNVGAFKPNKAGTMSLSFVDQNTATMSYTIDGKTQSATIVRQPY